MRPVLLPGLRRAWRDRETLQLGRPPGPAAVLSGVAAGLRAVLPLLDGTRDAGQVIREARRAGCAAERTTGLLDLLEGAGLLADAGQPAAADGLTRPERERLSGDVAALALVRGTGAAPAVGRRAGARVRVVGAGRVGAVVAGLLAVSGVGAVDVVDDATTRPCDVAVGGLALEDVGSSRGQAARARLHRLAPSVELHPAAADLVVVAPPDGLVPSAIPPLVAGSAAHLVAELRDGTGVVGPAVVPGVSACLHCLELTRSDLDPDWPALATQLAAAPDGSSGGSAALAAAVSAQAAGEALTLLDGWPGAPTIGGTLELVPPDWRWRRRSWAPHRDCGCVCRAG